MGAIKKIFQLTIKKRLMALTVLATALIIVVGGIGFIRTYVTADTMETVFYDQAYNGSALLLNADRDMYQALSALETLIYANPSESEKKDLIASFDENVQQTLDRVAQTATIFEADMDSWSAIPSATTGYTIFENMTGFQTDFTAWISDAERMITSGSYNGYDTLLARFEDTREYLNDTQETLDLNIAAQLASIERSNNTIFLLIGILTIVVLLGYFIGALMVIRSISNPLDKTVKLLTKMSEGDISSQLDIESDDEIGVMSKGINQLVASLNTAISSIKIASEQVGIGAQQVADSSMTLSQGATQQASSVEELSAAVQNIADQTQHSAQYADDAAKLADETKHSASSGSEQIGMMVSAMSKISDSSVSIEKVIKVIEDIAFQTNILALNAAVEAARAGQHGKGFAVVAEEVRNLAAKSAAAAQETTVLIEESVKNVGDGSTIAQETTVILNGIFDNINQMSDLVSEIASATNQQAVEIQQVNQGLTQISEVVQSTSAISEESAAASEELLGQADAMQEQVHKFQLTKEYQ